MHRSRAALLPTRTWLLAAALALLTGGCAKACQSGRLVEHEGALLADAKGNIDPPAGGETIALLPGDSEVAIPDAEIVKLAIDRRVPWGRVNAVVESVRAEGAEPAILVSRGGDVRGFVLEDEHAEAPEIELLGFPAGDQWKSCVRPRGGDKAKCVQQRAGHFIDAAYTREIVREAVRAYGSHDVLVGIPITIPWGDAVRLIDGARTCCTGEEVRVEVISLDARGAPQSEETPSDADAASTEPAEKAPGDGDAAPPNSIDSPDSRP